MSSAIPLSRRAVLGAAGAVCAAALAGCLTAVAGPRSVPVRGGFEDGLIGRNRVGPTESAVAPGGPGVS